MNGTGLLTKPVNHGSTAEPTICDLAHRASGLKSLRSKLADLVLPSGIQLQRKRGVYLARDFDPPSLTLYTSSIALTKRHA